MLYGPRDEHEADVIFGLIEAAVKRQLGFSECALLSV